MDYGEDYDFKRDVYVDNPLIFEHPDTIEDKLKQQFQHVVFN